GRFVDTFARRMFSEAIKTLQNIICVFMGGAETTPVLTAGAALRLFRTRYTRSLIDPSRHTCCNMVSKVKDLLSKEP
ncbi:MAG: hypothetical protein AAFY34_10985, partial [Pseudomonadota bacterium]